MTDVELRGPPSERRAGVDETDDGRMEVDAKSVLPSRPTSATTGATCNWRTRT